MPPITRGTAMLVASHTRACLAAFVLTSAAVPAHAQQRSFTIEQALSAPFPDELVAAPAGGALAWVFNAQGVRNLWIATGPDYQGRALTTYKEDDGQEIGELDRKSTRLNSSHSQISYAVFCLKKKKKKNNRNNGE